MRPPTTAREFALDLEREFLAPDEHNSGVLIERLAEVLGRLHSDDTEGRGRRPMGGLDYARAIEPIRQSVAPAEAALEESLEAFEGCIRWHDPNALFNITPAPLLDTVALSAATSLLNPNAIWDITSGKFLVLERRVVGMLAELAGWDPQMAAGVFASGGKATLTYAVKLGLNRSDPRVVIDGLAGRYVVFAQEGAHYSLEHVCNLLGLGRESCRRVARTSAGTLDVAALRTDLVHAIEQGERIACVVLAGGGTMNLAIDPVKAVRRLVDELVLEYELPYVPYLHFDGVISWAWLSFNHLPADELVELGSPGVRTKIERARHAVGQVRWADSFGVDFHKTGLCPYAASTLVCRVRGELTALDVPSGEPPPPEQGFGDAAPFRFTLENSRPCTGIISAYYALRRLGVRGVAGYVAFFLGAREWFAELIEQRYADRLEVVNTRTLGFELVVKPSLFGDRRTYAEIEAAPEPDRRHYREACDALSAFIAAEGVAGDNGTPVIGYVPRYSDGLRRGGSPALLLYPVSVYLDREAAEQILERLVAAIDRFEAARSNGTGARALGLVVEPPK